ncbi:MAG: DUF2141 domain-containing protein [Pseudomonadota bacterium]
MKIEPMLNQVRPGTARLSTVLAAAIAGSLFGGVAIAGEANAAAPTRILGPDPAACNADAASPAALIRVAGFKDREGQVRVQLYPDDPDKFLEGGEWIQRVDVPVTSAGYMDICVPLPVSGRLGMVVMHDRQANGKLDPFKDGAGLPGNPDMKLKKPKYEEADFIAGPGVTPMTIVLNYHRGLFGFGPVKAKSKVKAR